MRLVEKTIINVPEIEAIHTIRYVIYIYMYVCMYVYVQILKIFIYSLLESTNIIKVDDFDLLFRIWDSQDIGDKYYQRHD